MKIWMVGALCLATMTAQASSFVGNGGNVGDVELHVALRQGKKTLELIAKSETDDTLCSCSSEMERHAVCEPLQGLMDEERRYCARFLREKASSLAKLFAADEIHREWTHDAISVTEGGRLRAADAVADAKSNRLTLNQQRFLALSPIERVFLLTHEHLHFVSLNGKTLVDEGPQGPFKGAEGGRRFINSVAAAVAAAAQETRILNQDSSMLERSRADKQRWVYAQNLRLDLGSSTSAFAQDALTGGLLGVRYDFNEWGFFFEGADVSEKKKIRSSIQARDRRLIYAAGVSYRLHPFRDPLSFWGQSYLKFGAKLARIKAEYSLDDGFVQTLDSLSSSGWGLDCQYFMPFRWGLWAFASLGYLETSVKYSQPRFDQPTNVTSLGLGVAYGF